MDLVPRRPLESTRVRARRLSFFLLLSSLKSGASFFCIIYTRTRDAGNFTAQWTRGCDQPVNIEHANRKPGDLQVRRRQFSEADVPVG